MGELAERSAPPNAVRRLQRSPELVEMEATTVSTFIWKQKMLLVAYDTHAIATLGGVHDESYLERF